MADLYSALLQRTSSLKCSDMDRVSEGSQTFTCHPYTNHICLYSPAAGHDRPLAGTHGASHGGMARLSWLGWLLIYWDRFLALGVQPWTGHPSQY